MAIEIERRFLVRHKRWKELCTTEPLSIVQGYVAKGDSFVVRVRTVGSQAWLTLKSKKLHMTHLEYEYPIPVEDAREILHTIMPEHRIEKKRYHIMYDGRLWEIDEFSGENKGLCIAEVELEKETDILIPPLWVDEEITHDESFSNYMLSQQPYGKR